jgi:hypothetical protein
MPIVTTQSVAREIKSLLFVEDGSLNVVMFRFEDGVKAGEDSYRIEPAQASSILDIEPVPGLTVRQQIILSVYQFMIAAGMVSGVVQ